MLLDDSTHFHLFELPQETQERLYCFLNEDFRKSFFLDFKKKYKSIANAGRILNISEDKIRGWFLGKNVRKVPHRIIPIQFSILFKLSKGLNYDLDKVEPKIVALKTKGAKSKILYNPKLPIDLSYEFGRLIGTSLGDGHLTKNSTIVYTNSSKSLIEELRRCTKKLGHIYTKSSITKDGHILIIPNVIGIILNAFGVVSGDKMKQKENLRLPNIVFSSPSEFKLGIISGLFDDEGSVIKDGKIKFKQALPNVVEDLKNLLRSFNIHTSERLEDGKQFYFNIYRKADRLKISQLNIFKHPEKVNRLNRIIGGDKVD